MALKKGIRDVEKDLLEIFEHFGSKTQRKKLCEEFMELQDELFYIYDFGDDRENLISEIADMLVLILQFAYEYGYDNEDIIKQMKYKIKRTLERIESGYYEK